MAWSSDATHWGRVDLDPAGAGESVATAGARRQGLEVVVGTAVTSRGDHDGRVWSSMYGITWPAVPFDSGPGDQRLTSVAGGPLGFVAAGDDANADRRMAVVWTSADGVTWRRQPTSPDMAELPGFQSTSGVSAGSVAGSGPLLAAGDGYTLELWSSPDGRRWTRDDAPVQEARAGAGALVATDGRAALLLTGTSDPAGVSAGGYVDGLTASGDLVVAVGSTRPSPGARSVAAVWTSADRGDSWLPVDPANAAFSIRTATQMFDVTAGGPGFVAVGLTYTDEVDAQAWFSTDGRTWQGAAEPAAWSGPGDRGLAHVCPLPDGGVVAIGVANVRAEGAAWAWRSQDGRTWERVPGDATPAFATPGAGFPTYQTDTSRRSLSAPATRT